MSCALAFLFLLLLICSFVRFPEFSAFDYSIDLSFLFSLLILNFAEELFFQFIEEYFFDCDMFN